MRDSEIIHRLDALEKRVRDLEKKYKPKPVKKAPAKKKAGGKK